MTIIAILTLLPGSFVGSYLFTQIVNARVVEKRVLSDLGLYELVSCDQLRASILPRARCVFTAVAFWNALILFWAFWVAQMHTTKLALILASWVLFPIGARAAGISGLRSYKLELFLFTWLIFYGAFVFPCMAVSLLAIGRV